MDKQKIWLKLIRNKKNGQISATIPKRKLNLNTKKLLEKSKRAFISLEEFED